MKITNKTKSNNTTIVMRKPDKKVEPLSQQWWLAKSQADLKNELLGTVVFLKESQTYRQRQAAIYARLYGNMSLFSFIGSNINKMDQNNSLPMDRPTFNLIQSAVDALVSQITQQKPSPIFLTDGSDYRERRLAKQLNNFIQGEFFQSKAYEKTAIMLRDALVEGTGIIKIFETQDNKVGLDRVLLTELFVDSAESMYGDPRQLYQVKLIDRKVLMANFPTEKSAARDSEKAYPDNSIDSSKTISDLIMVVEGWRLPSSKNSGDGRHSIVCSGGVLLDEEYTKDKFPFVFLHYSNRLLGFWSQGLAEQLMGTQVEINSLLYTISRAIKLTGVPRVFMEMGSKVTKAHLTNDVGAIIEYQGTKPIYEVAPCVPQELYAQLQRLIEYGYQQSGVSALQAGSKKPAGLNSGEAIRTYDDISSDRFAYLSQKYHNVFIDLAYAITDLAMDIAKRDGSYQTVYPGKNGVKQIDLPKMSLLKDPFIIQCFNMSSLPRDPAGRMQKVVEMIQSGMISVKEGRRLLDYPDVEQIDRLANASEERIFQILDAIIENGEYAPPDPFLDLSLASELVVQYYNLYSAAKLEEEKCQMLRDWYTQVQTLIQAAQPPALPPQAALAPPQAQAEALPISDLVPNAVIGQ